MEERKAVERRRNSGQSNDMSVPFKTMEYLEFLKSKIEIAGESGFNCPPEKINKVLKHQRDAVLWALRGGRRALFESFGLGKTVQELEFCKQAVDQEGKR